MRFDKEKFQRDTGLRPVHEGDRLKEPRFPTKSHRPHGPEARVTRVPFALLLALLGGCASVPAGKSVISDLSTKPNASEVAFWHDVEARPLATNDDAFHGLLLYLNGDDHSTSYDERVSALKQRGLLAVDFHGQADEAVERGTLAVALVKALHLKGGLSMALFGASPRYALRELEYRNLFPDSSEFQLLSGAEFVGIIGRVEDFQEGDPANDPAKVLYPGAEPTPPLQEADADDVTYPTYLSTMANNLTLADPTSEPASQPSGVKLPEGPLTLVITGVRGKAEVRVPPEETWKKAEMNEELKEGAELRTGLKSAVQLQIRPDQTITVDRLGVVKIDRATLAAGKFVTSVSMSSGRVRYDIDAANREYDATVRSPNSTLGIRGTRVSLLDQRPFPPEAVSLTGTAQFRNIHRQLVALGRRNQGKTKITGDQTSAAQFALEQTVVDPQYAGARTPSEQRLINTVLSNGAVYTFNRQLGIPVISGGVPPTDAQLIPTVPGRLVFEARWDANVNFNIAFLGSTNNEVLQVLPGFVTSAGGGHIPFDHQGGPNGGVEVIYYTQLNDGNTNPNAALLALNESTTQSAKVSLRAFLDGKPYSTSLAKFLTESQNIPGQPPVVTYDEATGVATGTVQPRQVLGMFPDIESPDGSGQAPAALKVKAKPTPVGPQRQTAAVISKDSKLGKK
jgi:hypothetical protein